MNLKRQRGPVPQAGPSHRAGFFGSRIRRMRVKKTKIQNTNHKEIPNQSSNVSSRAVSIWNFSFGIV
jgi:hypothetical protein